MVQWLRVSPFRDPAVLREVFSLPFVGRFMRSSIGWSWSLYPRDLSRSILSGQDMGGKHFVSEMLSLHI